MWMPCPPGVVGSRPGAGCGSSTGRRTRHRGATGGGPLHIGAASPPLPLPPSLSRPQQPAPQAPVVYAATSPDGVPFYYTVTEYGYQVSRKWLGRAREWGARERGWACAVLGPAPPASPSVRTAASAPGPARAGRPGMGRGRLPEGGKVKWAPAPTPRAGGRGLSGPQHSRPRPFENKNAPRSTDRAGRPLFHPPLPPSRPPLGPPRLPLPLRARPPPRPAHGPPVLGRWRRRRPATRAVGAAVGGRRPAAPLPTRCPRPRCPRLSGCGRAHGAPPRPAGRGGRDFPAQGR